MLSRQLLLKLSPFVLLTLLNVHALSAHALAREGGVSGGGGDASEIRVNDIRADLLKWISEGGAESLKLPQGLSYETYRVSMVKFLAPHAVVIGFASGANEVTVNGQAKTCRGFVSSDDHLPHILCNTERFKATAESQQYQLIHHEYAGLAGVEMNIGASSDYAISTQVTEYLVPETVLRLSVKKPAPKPGTPLSCHGNCRVEDFVGNYALAGEAKEMECFPELSLSISQDGELLSLGAYATYGIFQPRTHENLNYYVNSTPGVATFYDWVVQGGDSLNLVSKSVNEFLSTFAIPFPGSVSFSRIQLKPTPDGKLQLIEYRTNERTKKYYVSKNCLYNRTH